MRMRVAMVMLVFAVSLAALAAWLCGKVFMVME